RCLGLPGPSRRRSWVRVRYATPCFRGVGSVDVEFKLPQGIRVDKCKKTGENDGFCYRADGRGKLTVRVRSRCGNVNGRQKDGTKWKVCQETTGTLMYVM